MPLHLLLKKENLMPKRIHGFCFAALAAAFYGTNPIFAVPLYGIGMNAVSVLVFRYLLGIPILAALIIMRSERLLPHEKEILPVAGLGIIMGISSLALYESYTYMNPGVASTLLFMYPLLTSLIMTIFFQEKFRLVTGISLLIMSVGLYLLMKPGGGESVSLKGFLLVFISSLTYSVYMVWIKGSQTLQQIPTLQSLLYQLLFGGLIFVAVILAGEPFDAPNGLFAWGNLAALAIFPTVLSLLLTIWAINCIGPTPTAIFGALEPITAVVLSILLLGETVTLREIIGGMLILASTMLVVVAGGNRGSAKQR